MKNIQLKKLELTNYRNVEHAIYEFNGNSKIVGDNKIGKTNTLEAIFFLLTNYLLGSSNDLPQIKPLHDTKLVVKVEGTFDVDGKEIVIAKEYAEDWVKQRNTKEIVLKGHYENYYYNGVKQSTVKDFNVLFFNDFGIKTNDAVKLSLLQLQVNPFYLGDLCETGDWKEVRKLIIELVGDITDEQVFEKAPNTAVIKEDLALYGGRLDQVRKATTDNIKTLQEDIVGDDAKLEMFEKVEKPSDDSVAIARKGIEDIDTKIAKLRSSTGSNELEAETKNKIAEIATEIAKLVVEDANAVNPAEKQVRDELSQKRSILDDFFAKKRNYQTEFSNAEWSYNKLFNENEQAKKDKDALLEQYYKVDETPVEFDTVCPTCHRPLEASEIESAKAKAQAYKDELLKSLVEKGTKLKDTIVANDVKIVDLKTKVDTAKDCIDQVNVKIDSLNADITALETKLREVASTKVANPRIAELEKQKAELEQKLAEIRSSQFNAQQSINSQIYELEQSKEEFKKVLSDLDFYDRQQVEKAKVEKEKEAHADKLVSLEQKKDLINMFIVTKLKMLDENVSKVFGGIKFKLLEENINGGFDTICKPYIYDPITKTSTNVIWKSGSKSERIVTGIAIAEAIKAHLELSNLPFLFDEGGELGSETIKNRLITDSQIICVKVQDGVQTPIVMSL